MVEGGSGIIVKNSLELAEESILLLDPHGYAYDKAIERGLHGSQFGWYRGSCLSSHGG